MRIHTQFLQPKHDDLTTSVVIGTLEIFACIVCPLVDGYGIPSVPADVPVSINRVVLWSPPLDIVSVERPSELWCAVVLSVIVLGLAVMVNKVVSNVGNGLLIVLLLAKVCSRSNGVDPVVATVDVATELDVSVCEASVSGCLDDVSVSALVV